MFDSCQIFENFVIFLVLLFFSYVFSFLKLSFIASLSKQGSPENVSVQTNDISINIALIILYLLKIYFRLRLLRYYATFKVRKFESLFFKLNTCLQKPATCIGLRAEQIYINIYFFSILGVAFTVPFLCYFQKLQLPVVKEV